MRTRLLLAVAAIVIVVLLAELVAQLVLPGIAADRVRDQLAPHGRVLKVEVSAFPALELLAHEADSVTVHMASYHSSTGRLSGLLQESSDTGSLHATADTFSAGLLTVHDATLVKTGKRLVGTAQVRESDLRHALPIIQSVTPIASSGGVLTLKGTADLPIVGQLTVPFTIEVSHGALIAQPDVPLVGGLATLQLFSNPHVRVQSISAKAAPGGFAVRATGTLR